MATNPFFNHYQAKNEQLLIDNLVVESIQTMGLDVQYIQRTQDNIDYLYKEDSSNYFEKFKTIEMYPLFVDGLDGEEMMSIFGNEFKKTATFIVSKSRFKEEFDDDFLSDQYRLTKPREGDLIYMPITKTIFEINYVNNESPYFEKGKQYVYELKVETFEYSYEDIDSRDSEEPNIEDILDQMTIDPYIWDKDDEFGDNDELELDKDSHLTFDPENPFGIK